MQTCGAPPLSNKISRALVAAGKSGEELAGRFVPTVRHPSIETSGRDGGRDVDPDGSTSVEVDAAVRRGGGGEMRMVGGIVDPNSVEVDVEETFEYAGIVSGENNARRKNDDGDGEEGRSMADSDDAPNPEESPESTAFADEAMAGESASRTPTLVPPTVPLDPREPEEVASYVPLNARMHSTSAEAEMWDWLEGQMSEEGEPTSSSSSSAHHVASPTATMPVTADVPRRPMTTKSRSFARVVSLLLILAIAIPLGIVLLGGIASENNANAKDVVAAGPDIAPGGGDAMNAPPCRYPASYCPVGTTLFSVRHAMTPGGGDASMYFYPKTWTLKESCSDDLIVGCLPCDDTDDASPVTSSFPLTPTLFDNTAPNATTTPPYPSEHSGPFVGSGKYTASSDGVSICIPDGNAYVFEVIPSDEPGDCCGFLPYSFVMSHNDVEVINDDSIFYDSEGNRQSGGKVSFPENAEPCPTRESFSAPSATPSVASTEAPSVAPS